MALAYVGLGSNLGDGRRNLLEAWQRLGMIQGITPLALSSPWLTRPVAKAEWREKGLALADAVFTNAVGVVESRLLPLQLLRAMQTVEDDMGRDRSRCVDRTIDLDLLYYDELVMAEPDLTLPHPELHRRLFVLAPLEELAPDRIHPGLGLTTRQMRAQITVGAGDVRRNCWTDD